MTRAKLCSLLAVTYLLSVGSALASGTDAEEEAIRRSLNNDA